MYRYDVRLSFMGRRGRLPEALRDWMSSEEERSKEKKQMHLVVALNYSGRYDIIEATKKIATKVKTGVLKVEEVDNTVLEQHLESDVIEFPNPDLLIRSSGELFFTKKLFPEFDETDFVEAIAAFQERKRRFGGHGY